MTLPKGLANKVYARDGWKCRSCNDRNGISPHHIITKGQRGPDTMENLITLCVLNCHRAIHDGDLLIEDPANANHKVKFVRVNGWKPK